MRSKNRIGFWIFTLGVLMLLLRPYLVYRATAADSRQANPASAWSLLQRLVKKKDDHHEQQADGTAMLAEAERSGIRPVLRLLGMISRLLNVFPRIALADLMVIVKFRLPVRTHRYRLSSCLLI